MSSEKPPILPSTPPPIPESSEEKKEDLIGEGQKIEIGGRTGGHTEATAALLKTDGQEFLNRMSEGGKKIASQVYEGLYKIPGIKRVVGKMEIVYSQSWINRHEEKAVGFKNKMDGINLKIGLFDQSKKEIESVIENLKQQNIPGVESLQIKLGDIDRHRMALLNEKDKVQTKFEGRENKIKLHANERDRVADKLIGRYNEKLEPMEGDLEVLQTHKDHIELLVAATEARHKEQAIKLEGIKTRKTQVEVSLRKMGMSERKVREFEAVKILGDHLAQGYQKMRTEKEKLAHRKFEVDKEIAKLDAKANPYRDKREEFVRVKKGRPLKMSVEARTREAEFSEREDVVVHTREDGPETKYSAPEDFAMDFGAETVEEDKENPDVSSSVSSWNKYLQEKYGNGKVSGEIVDLKDFVGAARLSGDDRLGAEDFENILTKYYKFRKMPTNRLNESIKGFFEEGLKSNS